MKKRQEVYDLYWYFACERQNIFWKKLKGEEAPWTEDKILSTYKFCNSYRVNDRVSQYLLKNCLEIGEIISSVNVCENHPEHIIKAINDIDADFLLIVGENISSRNFTIKKSISNYFNINFSK